jgi:hypothetical protein
MPSSRSDIESIAAEIAPRMIWLQIVHLALVASVAVFLAVMLSQGSAATEDRSNVAFIALICATASVAMSFVLPKVFRSAGLAALRGKTEIPVEALLGPFHTGHIAGIALLESAGFLACFALSGGPGSVPRWFVVIPIGILTLLLARFPRTRTVATWILRTREALIGG